MNVIKQIVSNAAGNGQTIKQIVKSNERGPQGEQGTPGQAATITAGNAYTVATDAQPQVMNTGTSSAAVFDFYIPKGEKGDPGAIQYTAGPGIQIDGNNRIIATGSAVATWGDIEGTLANQTDLKTALDAKQGTLTASDGITLSSGTISANIAVSTGIKKAVSGDGAIQLSVDTNTIAQKSDIGNGVLTIANNGTPVDSFTANASANKTISISTPVITVTSTDPGEGAALAANNFIAVYSVE